MGKRKKEAKSDHSKIESVRFVPKAEWDVIQAAYWYSGKDVELAEDFYNSLNKAIGFIKNHPESAPFFNKPIRKKNLNRFPYSVFYLLDHNQIVVQGVLHYERDRWRIIGKRIES